MTLLTCLRQHMGAPSCGGKRRTVMGFLREKNLSHWRLRMEVGAKEADGT